MAKPTKTANLSKRKLGPPLTAERLRVLLRYDPDSGEWHWLRSPGKRFKFGDKAGCARGDGYWLIRIEGRLYRAHRLAFLYMTGKWPKNQVDHQDRNPSNSKWNNLRESTQSQNMANTIKPRRNISGFKGVSWQSQIGRWQVHVGRHNSYIGVFKTREEAHAAYCKAAIARYGEFARFD
jgi:hypothetical protein